MNIDQAHNLTYAFLLASRRCMENRPLPNNRIEMLASPAVVCLAFSIEVGLKAIILSEGNTAFGHKFVDLFEKVSLDAQSAIIKEVGRDKSSFEAALQAANNTFTDWRYIYESGGANADIEFLVKLADAIQNSAEAAKK
jgi:hypothetical protein